LRKINSTSSSTVCAARQSRSLGVKQLIDALAALKIIPVIAIEDSADIVALGQTLVDNGLPVAEITFRTPAAARAIRLLRAAQPAMLIGAGTVLNRTQLEQAQAAGASFVVSPGFNPNTVRAAQALNMPIVPGVNNPSDIEAALELGLSALKFFPAEASGGVKMVKALLGPYTQIQLMPTGGISPANICDYLAIRGVIACGGSWMVEPELLKRRDWAEVGRRVRAAVALVAS
jgi:2-dehydro-3-deoxyphosphogluconate aldolase/(4S)-4-hydroxy-2-oxoglutarate aldolase